MPTFILSRWRQLEQDRAHAALIAEAIHHGHTLPARNHRTVKAEPGDLRGIPCLAKGVGGTIVSGGTTQPEAHAVLYSR